MDVSGCCEAKWALTTDNFDMFSKQIKQQYVGIFCTGVWAGGFPSYPKLLLDRIDTTIAHKLRGTPPWVLVLTQKGGMGSWEDSNNES